MQQIILLLLQFSLFLVVLAIGLDAERDDLLFMWRNPRQLARAFLAISIIVPIAAVAAVSVLPLRPMAKVGVILMSVSPVPPFVPSKDLKLGCRKSYVYGLFVAFALLAVVIVPVSVAILDAHYGTKAWVRPATMLKTLGTVAVPVAVGIALRWRFPGLAARWAARVSMFGVVLLTLLCIPVVIVAWPAIVRSTGDGTIIAIATTAAVAMIAGHLLGGPDVRDRAALANFAALRHPGIAMMIANNNFADKGVTAVILLYVLVSFSVTIVYQLWRRRSEHHQTPHPAPST